jgi:manganese transport protein
VTEVAAPLSKARRALRYLAESSGPGVVFLLASVGAQDFVSNATMGASYGYSSLWTLVLIVAARYLILESSSRYVLVTGDNLLTGYGRKGRWVVWVILVSLLLRRHISNLLQVLLLGSFAHLVLPLPEPASAKIWSLVLWSLGFALMYWGRYRVVERWGKPLIMLLGGSVATIALLSRPDPVAIAKGLFIPSVPPDQGIYSFAFLVMALVGTNAGSVGNLKYAAFVHEKG